MTPTELESELKQGILRPVYLVAGEERYLVDQAVRALRAAALAGAEPSLNEDHFQAGEADVGRVLAAARTMPMLAARRLVIVRSVERWESKGSKDDDKPSASIGPLDALADYAAAPASSAVLILVGAKVDTRRRFVLALKKQGGWVNCERLDDNALARWVTQQVAARHARLAPGVADLLVQVAGPEIGSLADAVERLSLFVGARATIDEAAVSEVVVRVRETSVFALVDAVGRRDAGAALARLGEVFDPRTGGLPLVGLLAWSVRQLLSFEAALRSGARPEDAAKAAGVPPFRARELSARIRGVSRGELERWLVALAEADLALKGSRRPARAVLETLLLAMAYRPSSP
ncbi:MAG: DNA polymerase III subunit delta [Polyangiaceae bacterium]|jgi:DNA polymerase-3 subunit delta|nr:DNA polymerase III subunit delta [Polyangiaceae bacterium]